ncbi:uncharacterized protein B0H18DRAFT_1126104 [Fomitopsis serialis]|uniref:uncharacterized protein n=1 Tax=Fomitopsis serialis TaxID=139415 RepID=UPI0020073CC0|nr:uncharacterized protein B0H18DRAFT_1126104 [Neoantrodia serialis]KAH9913613.1 hypothetical protein B0H18DRAFT_1126104 [Neoantrodia serialis]
MVRSDPRVKEIVNDYLPSNARLRQNLLPCETYPDVRHVAIVSLGASSASSLGKVFGICTLPRHRRCANHLKPGALQMTEAQLYEVRARVASLNPPARIGGVTFVGAQLPPALIAAATGPGRPHLQTETVVVYVYIRDGDVPVSLPLTCVDRGIQLQLTFRQPITCDILSLKPRENYELYDAQLGEFVGFPRVNEHRYFLRDEVLVYRAPGVVDCPGLEDLVLTSQQVLYDGPAPLPSLLQHMQARDSGDRSPSPDHSSQALLVSTPGRVLRSGRVITSDASPSTSSTSSPGSSRRHSLPSSSTGSSSAGHKRKRGDLPASPSKRAANKGKARMEEPDDADESDDEVWVVVDDDEEIEMLVSN